MSPISDRFVSQYGEENVILKYFGEKRGGLVVDVGCADGMFVSNSRYLINELGWRGILIDANPGDIARCRSLYRDRTDVDVVHIGVCTEPGVRPFRVYQDDISQLSTFSESFIEGVLSENPDKYGPPIPVMCERLERILLRCDCPTTIDFLSVDCEGTDLEVLASMDFETYHVSLICVEACANRGGVEIILDTAGFSPYAQTGGNLFFSRRA